ncbi:PepSY domain-containing protein [Rhizobium sp. AAP43]|uniref:PepSY domain-containing protein n=1 Tax=Rhizobium sp. AAP43 TaxID=1523420 RepID=UPI0006B9DE1D|nr:hypothetical protein [Rhizobium sp. AAP43]KPF47425.1 hypothetical protein IP76_01335 [Rhizobium sp. AAP43]
MDRRLFLVLLLSATCLAGPGSVPVAMAKDGEDDDNDSDSGKDSDNSGSSNDDDDDDGDDGGDSSGSDDGDDDSDDDAEDDDEDDSSGNGSGSSGRSGSGKDRQRLREAVENGRILPLREILKKVEAIDSGRVISVDLNLKSAKPYYTFKMQNGPRVKTIKLDASTGRKLNLFGW